MSPFYVLDNRTLMRVASIFRRKQPANKTWTRLRSLASGDAVTCTWISAQSLFESVTRSCITQGFRREPKFLQQSTLCIQSAGCRGDQPLLHPFSGESGQQAVAPRPGDCSFLFQTSEPAACVSCGEYCFYTNELSYLPAKSQGEHFAH